MSETLKNLGKSAVRVGIDALPGIVLARHTRIDDYPRPGYLKETLFESVYIASVLISSLSTLGTATPEEAMPYALATGLSVLVHGCWGAYTRLQTSYEFKAATFEQLKKVNQLKTNIKDTFNAIIDY